jgi:predicted Zn-dependent protease
MPLMKPCVSTRCGWLLLLAFVCACATVPYTGRSQLVLMPESQEVQLGVSAYREVLGKAVLVRDPEVLEVVRRVGERIARVADKPTYQWEFSVIDDDSMINAFALPGGKVAVYTGLFEVAQDEAGLAAVVGHEVAHALARHGAERMSQGVLAQLGAVGLSVALGGGDPRTADAILQAYGLGAQVGVLLPFGRAQESEADHIGLILMAKAGYDPEAALRLWERMEQLGGKSPPEFLSTHPSYGTRQKDIKRWLPEANRHYQPTPEQKIAKLPTAADLEQGEDHGEAALKRYARTINNQARSRDATRILIIALGETLEVPAQTIERRQRDSGLTLGEVGVASALAKAGAGSFEDVLGAYKKGKSWTDSGGRNEQVLKGSIALLRSALVEARRLAREYGQRDGR